jgi:hypothetical protein
MYDSHAMRLVEAALVVAFDMHENIFNDPESRTFQWNTYPDRWGQGDRWKSLRLRTAQWDNSRHASLEDAQDFILLKLVANKESGLVIYGYAAVLDGLNPEELILLAEADQLCDSMLSTYLYRSGYCPKLASLSLKDAKACRELARKIGETRRAIGG